MKGWKELKAECGAPIWVLYDPDKKGVAISALVLAGSCDEHWPQEAGLAHATEHMVFQSTKKFKGSKELSKQIEGCGGDLNAQTGQEETFFYATLPVEFAQRGFVHLNEMLVNPLFEPKKIKTEMQTIVQEIKLHQDNPISIVSDIFMKSIYGKHPFARSEIGTKESVLSFRKKDFLSWKEKFYYPENFIFIISGGLKPEKAKDFIDKFFHKSAVARTPNDRVVPINLIGKTPRFLFVPRNDWKQAKVLIGTATVAGNSVEAKALNFFANMLNGESGPLFQEVRDKRGLAYSAQIGTQSSKFLGLIQIYVGTDTSKYKKVMELVNKVINKNKNSRKLFKETKIKLLGATSLQFDILDYENMLELSSNSILLRGHPITFEEKKKEILSVTLEQVEAAVDKYLDPDRLTTVVVGPEIKK